MTRSNIGTAINDAHARVEAARTEAVRHAAECGRLLAEAKATVPYGQWDEWVTKHCAFSLRTAQLYMKLARYLEDSDPAKAQRVAHLSLREISRELATSKPNRPREARPASREELIWRNELLKWWYSGHPEARILFIKYLLSRGDVTGAWAGRAIQAQIILIDPKNLARLDSILGETGRMLLDCLANKIGDAQ